MWVGSEERRLNRDVLEELLSRLRDAQDKVKTQSQDNIKADLVTALQLFFASKDKLAHVETEVRGGVTWWASRSERDCRQVEQWWSSEEAREDREKGLLMDEDKVRGGKRKGRLGGEGGEGRKDGPLCRSRWTCNF